MLPQLGEEGERVLGIQHNGVVAKTHPKSRENRKNWASAIAIEGSFLIFPSSDQADSYQRDKHFRGWQMTLYPGSSSGG